MIQVAGLAAEGELVRVCEIQRTVSLRLSLLPRENSWKCASVAVTGTTKDAYHCNCVRV
jgi:hypothetical protein